MLYAHYCIEIVHIYQKFKDWLLKCSPPWAIMDGGVLHHKVPKIGFKIVSSKVWYLFKIRIYLYKPKIFLKTNSKFVLRICNFTISDV